MSLLKHISNFIIEKVLPIKFKVWLLDRLACDIASQGEDGDTELAHINSYEAKLLKSVGGSGTINKTTGLRQYGGGGSKGGGGGGGGTTTQTVTKEEFPPEIRPYITDILERAQAQEEARQAVGYPIYPGPRIAAFTPEERAAQAGITSLVGSQIPTFDVAKGLTAASAMEDTAPAIQARMSPYMQNVVDIQKREAERGAEARRQQLAAQGVAAGGYGGTREAFMQSELDRNLQQQLGDIQATGSQAAFQQAQQGLANLRQRQMGAGQQMAGLGTAQQASAMKELGALSGVGEQQRQQQQKALDLGFQQFREEQTYPEASLQQYQSIIRGFPISPTTTQTQQAILPQPSLSQQLIGGAGALAGLGIAGQIPKLFKEGGSATTPFIDYKRIAGMGKNKNKKISKGDNKEYTEMLMAMIEGTQKDKAKEMNNIKDMMMEIAGNESTGLQSVVKLQAGSINPQFTLGTNPLGTSRGLTLPQVQPTFSGNKEEESLLDRLKKLINMDKVSSGMENVINQNNITSSDLPDISKSTTPFIKDVKKSGAALSDFGEKFTGNLGDVLGDVKDRLGNVRIKGRNYFINPEDEPEKLLEAGKEILETSTPEKFGPFLDDTQKSLLEEKEKLKEEKLKSKEDKVTYPKPFGPPDLRNLENVLDENTGGELGQEQKEKIKNELSASDNFRQLVSEQSKNLRDKIQKRKDETKEEYDKRLGFAIFNASLKYMAGDRLQESLMAYGKDAAQIAKDKRADLERLEDRELKAEDNLLDRTAQAMTMDLQEKGLEIKEKGIMEQAKTNRLTQERLDRLAGYQGKKLDLLVKSASTMPPESVKSIALNSVDLNSILPEEKVQNTKGDILSKKAFPGKSVYVPDEVDAVSIQAIYLDLKDKEPETRNDILIAKARQLHYTNLFNSGALRKRKLGGIAKLLPGPDGDIVRK
jgi:hypothetical protein